MEAEGLALLKSQELITNSCGVLAITRTILTGDLTVQSDVTCT